MIQKIGLVGDKLVDKYLPAAGPYALELSFLTLVIAYAAPKLVELYQAKRAAKYQAPAPAPAPVPPSEQTAPPRPGRDSRLDAVL